MDEKLTTDNNEFLFNNKESEYNNLINRLKEISKIIVLLEKQYSNKFF